MRMHCRAGRAPRSASDTCPSRPCEMFRSWPNGQRGTSRVALFAVERAILAIGSPFLVEAEPCELLAQRVAIEPEQLGRFHLIAAGACEHEVEQRALDALEDLVVEVVDRIAVDPREQAA